MSRNFTKVSQAIRQRTICGLFVICAGLAFLAGPGEARGTVVAEGDGFKLTQAEVEEFQRFVERGPFKSSEKEYQRVALQVKLFVLEAKALGLDSDDGMSVASGEEPLPRQIELFNRYAKKLVSDYEVSDLAIESFYRAHPETMTGPLDDALKEEIRNKILRAKAPHLLRETFKRLKEKYHVRVLIPAPEGGVQ